MRSTAAESATQANAAKAAGSATKTIKATKAAHAAAKTAAAAAKTGWGVASAGGVGKGVLLKGAAVGTFAARKAALPALVVGGAFGGAAWFGTYELVSGAMTTVLPPPANPTPRAHTAGLAAVPCTVGASAWAGWRFCPPLAPPPERLLDLAGWASCLKSVPVKHCGAGVVVSATVAAVACRVVQYRGGA